MPTPDCCNHARIIVCKNILENNISKKFSIGSLNIVYKGVQGSKGPGGPRTCCMLPIHQKTYHDHKTPKPFRERKNSKKKPRRYLTRDRSLSNETCVMFNVFWIATTLRAVMRISGIIAWIILFWKGWPEAGKRCTQRSCKTKWNILIAPLAQYELNKLVWWEWLIITPL